MDIKTAKKILKEEVDLSQLKDKASLLIDKQKL